jgi:2-haloacid dehalogenase
MRVDAVVFDVGRVLFEWDLAHLLRKVEADPARLDVLISDVVTEQWHYEADSGRSLSEMVPERIARYPHHAEAIRAYATRFNETIPGPVEGSLALVERLAARAVPLFAITNFGAEFWAGFRPTQPVFDHFRDIVVSGEEKLAKPDPAIFALAQARFRHAADRMLFIDDSAANIASARACGWQVHHFVSPAALEQALEDRELI